ncbi:MAG: hypothetical protein A3G49_00900 [Candidatus Sungbacteria bacterium RIFCSPLOWO2_12_FULL_41_11]|uniref:Uncharacterized protein n=1 Tax=Candidatus Sungbacteria bacterium RIFCSPLOWO2_12_FULL_41_11 TaxID=1802286 RepID=A0A1G2LP30_9BACT|nr:MAG: hypothetical protein A3D41_03600 [Candidatus Sungbacteria bacterium RIFCSPHIGHO2_02_FULL_41_12b]OHA13367.1 MAG: hypothetical protein A3G49_00900 [Candidatus Sungbacteria bacterium RIFCSPLOWO2_12_FULL_41_11]
MKEYALGAVLIISGFLLGWAWNHVYSLDLPAIVNLTPNLWYLGFILLYVVSFSILAVLVRTWWVALLAIIFSVVAVYLSFPFVNLLVWGIIGGGLLMFWSYYSIRTNYDSSARIYLARIVGKNLGTFFTALALIFSVLYFGGFKKESDAVSLLIPENVFIKFVQIFNGPLQSILPDFRPSDTIDQFLEKSIRAQLESQGLKVEQRVLDEAVREQRSLYAKDFGLSITGKEKIIDIMYALASSQIKKLTDPFKQYVPVIFSVGFFLSLRALSFVFYYASFPFIWSGLALLESAKFVKRETIQVEKEMLVL